LENWGTATFLFKEYPANAVYLMVTSFYQ